VARPKNGERKHFIQHSLLSNVNIVNRDEFEFLDGKQLFKREFGKSF